MRTLFQKEQGSLMPVIGRLRIRIMVGLEARRAGIAYSPSLMASNVLSEMFFSIVWRFPEGHFNSMR